MATRVKATKGVARVVVVLLGAQVVVLGIRALALLERINLLGKVARSEWVTLADAEVADSRVQVASGVWLLLFVSTVIAWCIWQHRAQHNARELSSTRLDYTAGWAVGWWFVPFANYVKPFSAVREMWRASAGSIGWRSEPSWHVLGWWWGTWVASNLLGSLRAATSGAEVESLRRGDVIAVVSVMLGMVAAILAVRIVRSITARQAIAVAASFAAPGPPIGVWGVGLDGMPLPPGPPVPPPPPTFG